MSRLSRALAAFYLALLVLALLTPTPPPNPPDPLAPAAPIEGLVADLVRNLLLLLPLGWLLAASGVSTLRAMAIGLVLSVLVELVQQLIPGRHGTLADVVANATSAGAGALLYTTRREWLEPDGRLARRIGGIGFVLACAVLVLGVQALRPSLRGPEYYAGLRPALGHYERYAGRVESARLGSLALAGGRVANDAALAEALASNESLVVVAELRPSRSAPAAIFTIHDAAQYEVLALVADAGDLFLEQRTRAADLGFDQPIHRWAVGLADADGPTGSVREIRIERRPGEAELWIDGRSLGTRRWRPGSVGNLLLTGRAVVAGASPVFEASTLALLVLPFAYCARSPWPATLAFALVLLGLPWLGPIGPAASADWIGLGLGVALARAARRWRAVRAVGLSPTTL